MSDILLLPAKSRLTSGCVSESVCVCVQSLLLQWLKAGSSLVESGCKPASHWLRVVENWLVISWDWLKVVVSQLLIG